MVFPNPSKGDPVTLEFNQPSPGWVSVKIFTIAFRKVRELNGLYPAGTSTMTITPLDEWQRPLANGVYYLLVESSAGRQITRMLILK